MSEFYEILKVAGPWGAPVIAFVVAYARGYLATGRELKQANDQLEQERAERLRERTELRQEISYWRDLTWSGTRIAEGAVGALPQRNN